ncbi:MAG: DUF4124 domain-containing protein [Gammaproteobacteria bacterium]|nr:DUF4124 domain-containing protein [Gammaproteobacteria bacterium]
MTTWTSRCVLTALLLGLLAGAADAQSGGKKLYRWVDKTGQVHYGDTIPPEYANQDREVLNQRGVAVGREQGEVTAEEAKAQEAAARAEREARERQRRDRMLLSSYQSVQEIEVLRDRRIELVDSQLTIQEQSLANLRKRHADLEKQAARYQPVNKDPGAEPLPEGLAADLERSRSDIATQAANLAKKREERASILAAFAADIQRFQELRAVAPR